MEGRFDNITIVWDELDRHYGAPKIVTAEVLVELQELERKRKRTLPGCLMLSIRVSGSSLSSRLSTGWVCSLMPSRTGTSWNTSLSRGVTGRS